MKEDCQTECYKPFRCMHQVSQDLVALVSITNKIIALNLVEPHLNDLTRLTLPEFHLNFKK